MRQKQPLLSSEHELASALPRNQALVPFGKLPVERGYLCMVPDRPGERSFNERGQAWGRLEALFRGRHLWGQRWRGSSRRAGLQA